MSTPTIHPTKTPISGRRVLTIPQVRRLCGVSRRTVYNWMDSGLVEWAGGLTRRYIYADSIPLFNDLQVTQDEAL
jgi:hypothetical protein